MSRAAALAVLAAATLVAPACGRTALPSVGGAARAAAAAPNPSGRKASADGPERRRTARPPQAPPARSVTSVYRMSPVLTWAEDATSHPAAPTVRSLQDPSLLRCQLEQSVLAGASGVGQALFAFPVEMGHGFSPLGGGVAGQPVEATRALTSMSTQEFARYTMRNVAMMSPIGGCGTRFSVFVRGSLVDSPEFLVHHR